jgi:enoyl-CoA hydratase/carnithine racemase
VSAFELERSGQVAIVRIARPPVNAIRFEDWDQLAGIVSGLADADAGAVVLTGAPGPHFSAGNDRTQFGPSTAREIERGTARVITAIRALRELPVPCIAAVHGAALGSAMLLMAMCDIRIATPDAQIGLPEILAGAFGGYRLAREVLPEGEARLMAYTGQPISGTRAHQLGVVQELVDGPDALLSRAVELGAEIADLLRGTLSRSAKPLLNRIDDGIGLWDGHDLERLTMIRFMGRDGG